MSHCDLSNKPENKCLSFFCRVCQIVTLSSSMETVDQAPEMHLEEIQFSLSEPAGMETLGQRPTGASPETPGMKDGYTPSPSERTPTAWRVVHYTLCVLTVVVVWSVALLPSVLTFSIIRSPVEVMDLQNQGTIWQYTYGLSHSVHILLEGIEAGTDRPIRKHCLSRRVKK